MTSPGINPPPDARSGRIGELRDNYGRGKPAKVPQTGERSLGSKLTDKLRRRAR